MLARHHFLHARWSEVALLAMALHVAACAKDGDTEESGAKGAEGNASIASTTEAKLEGEAETAVTIAPKLGGSVLAVGESQVEVAVFENGAVKGLVYDVQGKPVSDRASVEFAVTLHAASGATPKADLTWSDACTCFAGQAEVEGKLAVQPIDVSLKLGERSDLAKLETYALLPAPKLDVEANAGVSASASAPEPPKANARLTAGAGAKGLAELKAPKVDLQTTSGTSAKASASVSVPKPSVRLDVGKSTSTTSTKNKASAGVKAGASFGFGTK